MNKAKCPFLEEVIMVYCSACQSRKMLPKDQLVMQNSCEGEYNTCPIFKEFLSNQKKEEMMPQEAAQEKKNNEAEKPCIWMKAGVIAYRMCTSNYDCKNCEFDQALTSQEGSAGHSSLADQAIQKLRKMPASDRKCRYMLTGDFTYKICPNNYECWHCAVDQYIQDTIDMHPYLQRRRQKLAKRIAKVKGFTLREDFYYLPNHIWVKVEGETLKIGIDDFAARLIGKIDKISFPAENAISKDGQCWSLDRLNRSTKMSLPMDAEVIEKNDEALADPAVIQNDPYNRGWLLKVKSSGDLGDLLKGTKAAEWLEEEFDKLHQELEDNAKITITDGGELVDDLCSRLTDDEWSSIVKRFVW